MSTIHFVGGEKGGVGKSVVARLLSQYFIDNDRPWQALDADRSHPTLSRYYGEFSAPLNLDEYESIDQVMELAAEQECNVLIDLPAQSQRFLDRWIEDNGVLELCQELAIPVYFWHLVDDGRDSASLLAKFLNTYRCHLNCVVVKNGGCGRDFSEVEAIPLLADGQNDDTAIAQIYIPELHSATLHKLDRNNLSFWAAANLKDADGAHLGMMERQRTKVWLKKCYAAFDSVLPG